MVFLAEYFTIFERLHSSISSLSISSYCLLLYLPLFPCSLFCLLNSARVLNAIFLIKELRKQDPIFNINNPLPLSNLAQIEHVFIDKTSMLSIKPGKLDLFLTPEAPFMLDDPMKQKRGLKFAAKYLQRPVSMLSNDDMDEDKGVIQLKIYEFNLLLQDIKKKNSGVLNSSVNITKNNEKNFNNNNKGEFFGEKIESSNNKEDFFNFNEYSKGDIPNKDDIIYKSKPLPIKGKSRISFLNENKDFLTKEPPSSGHDPIDFSNQKLTFNNHVSFLKQAPLKQFSITNSPKSSFNKNISFESFESAKLPILKKPTPKLHLFSLSPRNQIKDSINLPYRSSQESVKNIPSLIKLIPSGNNNSNSNNSKINSKILSLNNQNNTTNNNEDFLDEKSFKMALIDQKLGVREALIAILLCSQARLSQNHNSPCFPDETALLQLCAQHGFLFLNKSKNPSRYLFQLQGQIMEVNIAGINEYTNERGRYSIITYDPDRLEEGAMLFVKGLAHKTLGSLKTNRKKIMVEEIIAEGEKNGKLFLIYGSKKMNGEELEGYLKKTGLLKSNLEQRKIEKNRFFAALECDLEYLLITSIENELNEGVEEVITLFQTIGIKLFLLSGDSISRVLATAYLSNIINPTTELWRIIGRTPEEVEVAFKALMETLQDVLKRKMIEKQASFEPKESGQLQSFLTNKQNSMNFYTNNPFNNDKKSVSPSSNTSLVVSGEAFALILQSPYLYYHFAFICNFAQAVIGFKMRPKHKAELLKLVREGDRAKPRIMAIGNGFNDIQMLQESDFGIEIRSELELQGLDAGDVLIGTWKIIGELVLVHGRSFAEKLEQCFYFSFYCSFLFTFSAFLINSYNGFAGVLVSYKLNQLKLSNY